MRRLRALVTLALAAASLAGCVDGDGPVEPQDAGPGTLFVEGTVVDERIAPVAGARLVLRTTGERQTTDTDGAFRFGPLDRTVHLIDVAAAGFENTTVAAHPGPNGTASLRVALVPVPSPEPWQRSQHFSGLMQCGHEALIVSGSCDAVLRYMNDEFEKGAGSRPLPEPLEARNEFDVTLERGWRTMVVDVVFDASAQPGTAGLRVVLRGPVDADELGAYEQYGRWSGDQSFTFHVAPGGDHPHGDAPVPDWQNTFRIQVLPHSHGYHAACVPVDGTCFLGAAAGADIAFDVYVTEFHREAAPDGWSLQA